ncbi:hypothetical protein EON65_02010 [archaeon]|nr:MAG: hypothetical protein EON65_02010 [archaeon]
MPTSLADKSLFLQHVHGFETKTCRNNLAYTSSVSDIVYTVGLYGITYNLNTKSQKIYKVRRYSYFNLIHPLVCYAECCFCSCIQTILRHLQLTKKGHLLAPVRWVAPSQE